MDPVVIFLVIGTILCAVEALLIILSFFRNEKNRRSRVLKPLATSRHAEYKHMPQNANSVEDELDHLYRNHNTRPEVSLNYICHIDNGSIINDTDSIGKSNRISGLLPTTIKSGSIKFTI